MPDPYGPMLAATARRLAHAEDRQRDLETIEVGYSMGDVIGSYLALPGLRGFWPFSSVNESGNVLDLSGQGRTLTNTNAATFGIQNQSIPYATLNGSNQYFTRADEAGLDITGELTLGLWYYLNAGVIGYTNLMGKWGPYALIMANTYIGMGVNNGGTDFITENLPLTAGKWNFVWGRYQPSTSVTVGANGTQSALTTSIPAALQINANPFYIGFPIATAYANGGVALGFLCAAALPDVLINRFYNISRTFFGV